ncbi:TonB-dependent receptor plug domain-containing protein [Erythrobacter sp. R86502]|uniref:TonB-dependent receptor plug domain-containing protein n=1 Tax=Erythrobacter sp. R86502 TaxID=3093846 RepID=UPI0036D2749F
MRKISILKAGTAPIALGLMVASVPAFAQDQADADGVANEQETRSIVVTGSRIARPDLDSASPVTTVSGETIGLTGTLTLEELINDLPQLIPGNNRTSNNSGGESFATLDLRGLGPNRTLILVDGERVAASSTTGAVDISQIPTSLIERVDVVTGGATAVYGSDAVAGVINFILKDDFEGLELTFQNEISGDGAGYNYAINGVFGGNFDDGRGNVALAVQYYDRDPVSQGRFDYSRTSGALGLVDDTLVVVDDPADLGADGAVIFSGGSATNPFGTVVNNGGNPFQGLATNPGVGPNFASFDNDCNPATANTAVNGGSLSFDTAGNLRPNSTGGQCAIPVGNSSRYSFNDQNFLLIPFDRLNVSSIASYEFTDKTSAKFFGSYTRTTSVVNLAPTPAAGGTGFLIPVDSPLIPADLAAALATRPDPLAPFNFNRRFAETGPRIGTNESQQLQLRTFVTHELSDDWTATAVASYGRTDFDSYSQGNINRVAVDQGLRGCQNSAGVVGGAGILPGCVTVDIFGANALTPTMVNFIQTDTYDFSEFEQVRAALNLAGSLFELPGGPVGVAVGAEYRKDTGLSVPDDAKQRGEIIGFNASQPIAGSIDVKEVYGEIRVPVLGGDGFPELLAFEAGARYSDYSSVGTLFNYKFGVEFAPFEAIRFRATYNKAARAPSVFELFQNGDQGFPSYSDPCNQINAARDTAFCQAQFTAAGANPALVTGFAQSNQQVQAFAFGNPGLTEEDAETYTIGAVIAPDSFPLGRFSATIDYYNIKLQDRIAAQGAQFFLNQCFNQQLQSACDRIVRSSATGEVESINTTLVNGDTDLQTSGIDVGLNWAVPLFSGRLTINELLTWVDKFDIGGTDFVDTADAGIGAITSEWASTLQVAYQQERFTGQVRYVYKSGGDQSGALFGPDEDTGFRTPRVPDLHVVDLSLRYKVSDGFAITGIVNNVLNDTPPQTAVGTFEQANTNVSFYSPLILGRTYTVQATLNF